MTPDASRVRELPDYIHGVIENDEEEWTVPEMLASLSWVYLGRMERLALGWRIFWRAIRGN